MRTTAYFQGSRSRSDRVSIRDEWIQRVLDFPDEVKVQVDGRVQLWGYVEEVKRHLRVVVLADRLTVHNAFFDRGRGRTRR